MSETKIRSNIGGTYGIQLPQIHPGDEEDPHHPHPQHGHHPVPPAGIRPALRRLQVRDSWQLRQRCGAAGPEICPQRHLLSGTAGHRPVPRRAEQRQVRPRAHGPAHHPDGRRLPCLQLHPPAPQGAGQGRLSEHPGGQPELLGPREGQRLPDDSASGPPGHRQRVLRRYALRPAQSGRSV